MRTAILKKLVVTEKSTALNTRGQYVFLVTPESTKSEIRKAVQSAYKVGVTSVNIIVTRARRKKLRGKPGREKVSKKAVVTLKTGEKIDVAP